MRQKLFRVLQILPMDLKVDKFTLLYNPVILIVAFPENGSGDCNNFENIRAGEDLDHNIIDEYR